MMLKLDDGQKPVSDTCLWFGHTLYPYVLLAAGFPARFTAKNVPEAHL